MLNDFRKNSTDEKFPRSRDGLHLPTCRAGPSVLTELVLSAEMARCGPVLGENPVDAPRRALAGILSEPAGTRPSPAAQPELLPQPRPWAATPQGHPTHLKPPAGLEVKPLPDPSRGVGGVRQDTPLHRLSRPAPSGPLGPAWPPPL